jgi:hypothetical protein
VIEIGMLVTGTVSVSGIEIVTETGIGTASEREKGREIGIENQSLPERHLESEVQEVEHLNLSLSIGVVVVVEVDSEEEVDGDSSKFQRARLYSCIVQ